ncbi:MAG: CBS domain-containing protein [Elainellaceae cyanobacterium]
MPAAHRRSLQFLRLEQILNPEPLTVAPDLAVAAVVDRMGQVTGQECSLNAEADAPQPEAHSAGCALIVGQRLLGIFTERDLVQLLSEGVDLDQTSIFEVMTQPVITLKYSEAENTTNVLSALRQHKIRQLPIVNDDGELLGLVTQTDIRRAMQPFNFLKFRRIKDVMIRQVVQAGPSESLLSLTRLMAQNKVSCTVITKRGRYGASVPIGILTERDMLQFRALGLSLSQTSAQAVMSTPLFLVRPQDTLWTAYQQMQQRHIRRLVVASDAGDLAGIVTQTSLLQLLDPMEMLEDIEQLQQVSEAQAAGLTRVNQQLHQVNDRLQSEITERQRLEAALQNANRILEERIGVQAAQLVKANEALKQEVNERQQVQEQLEKFFAVAPSLLCIAGLDGYFKRVNNSFEKVLGYSAAELSATPFLNFVHPEDRLATQTEVERLARGQTTVAFENRYRAKDGGYRWLSWYSTASLSEQRIYAAARDITARKFAEQALARQYQQKQLLSDIIRRIRESLEIDDVLHTAVLEVRTLLDCSHVLIVERQQSTAGRVIKESMACEDAADAASQVGLSLRLMPFSADLAFSACACADLDSAPCTPLTLEFLRRYGTRSCIEVPICIGNQLWGLIVAGQGDRTRRWQGFEVELMQQLANHIGVAISHARLLNDLEAQVVQRTRQLTEANGQLKQEIEERIRIETALLRSEARLQLTTDTLPALICYIDTGQRYCFNNQTYEHWFKQSAADLQGKHIREVLGEAYYGRIKPHVEAALSGQQRSFETEITTPDGKTRALMATYIPEFDPEGMVMGFFAMINDISDRKASERMKDEFVSVVGHELRTPLTSIQGALRLLSSGHFEPLGPQASEFVDIALRNTQRLTRLVNDVLDLERIESGQVMMPMASSDLAELMQQACEAMRTMADGHRLQIEVDPLAVSVWVNADAIIQVLTNLLSNAIKFSPPRSVIKLSAEKRKDDTLVQVVDCGRGIPPDKLETVFERFQQVDASDSRQLGGTGLGLAICRNIVQRHGGKIWVKSVLGVGSAFYFTLPDIE